MNKDPCAYATTCEPQVRDAAHFLQEYSHLIKWTEGGATIMDIGCAEGRVTFESLYPQFPADYRKFVMVDISSEMLRYASEKAKAKDSRIQCTQMDITASVPADFRNSFDHIFSFCCLHYVHTEKTTQALRNIFDMMKPGGRVLLSVIVKGPPLDVCRSMKSKGLWPSRLDNFINVISDSPYHRFEHPECDFPPYLQEAGFEVLACHYQPRTHKYRDWDTFLEFAFSIVPMTDIPPGEERDSFINDYATVARQSSMIEGDCGPEVHMTHTVLTAVALKPCQN